MPVKPTSVRLDQETLIRIDKMIQRIKDNGAALGGITRSKIIEMALFEGLSKLEERFPVKASQTQQPELASK